MFSNQDPKIVMLENTSFMKFISIKVQFDTTELMKKLVETIDVWNPEKTSYAQLSSNVKVAWVHTANKYIPWVC